MIRLSRQAWNNVLIVTMIVMIFLFNSTNNMLTGDDSEPQERLILPQGSLILTLEFDALKVERIGRSWRTDRPAMLTEEQMLRLVTHWREGKIVDEPGPVDNNTIVAVIWLAGEEKGRVFELFSDKNGTYIYSQNERYRVLELTIEDLIPAEIINA